MVAITVILAAVIGVFVLGLADDLGDGAAPTNSVDISYDASDGGSLILAHQSGDSVDEDDLELIVRDRGTNDDISSADDLGSEEFSVGSTITLDHEDLSADLDEDDVTVQLIHSPSDSIMATQDLDDVSIDDGT